MQRKNTSEMFKLFLLVGQELNSGRISKIEMKRDVVETRQAWIESNDYIVSTSLWKHEADYVTNVSSKNVKKTSIVINIFISWVAV